MSERPLTNEEHVRAALRRLNPQFHKSDISWPSLDAIMADLAAAQKAHMDTMRQCDELAAERDAAQEALLDLEALERAWHNRLASSRPEGDAE